MSAATRLDPRERLRGSGREAWLEYEDDMRGRHLSARTIEAYGAAAAQLQLWLDGHEPGTDITAATARMVRQYLAWAGEKPRSPGTAANRHRCLVQFFRYLAAEEIVTPSPMARVQCPQHEYRAPPVIADEHIAALLACVAKDRSFAGIRDEAIIRIWCEPGSPRASEMAGILADQTDMEAKTITLTGKGSRVRVIGMSPGTARALYRYRRARAARRDAGLPVLFLGMRGAMTRSGMHQMLAGRCRQAGVPHMHPHQLRHTAFADFDDASGNVNHAMALFGWSSPAMAHYYGREARGRHAVAAAAGMARADRFAGSRRAAR